MSEKFVFIMKYGKEYKLRLSIDQKHVCGRFFIDQILRFIDLSHNQKTLHTLVEILLQLNLK